MIELRIDFQIVSERLPLTVNIKTTFHNSECTEADKTHGQTYVISVLSQAECVKDRTCSLKEQAALCKLGKVRVLEIF